MIVNPTNVQRDALAEQVRNAINLREDEPSRGPLARPFKAIKKKFSLRQDAKPDDLLSAVFVLCAYARYQKAVDASVLLGEIDPRSWRIDYNYVRASIQMSAFFAERAGDETSATSLRPYIAIPSGYQPAALLLSGKTLRLSFEQRPYEGSPLDMTSTIAGDALHDISDLSTMWLFGGSVEWPRDRILSQVDATIGGLHALKGWQPW